MQLLLLFKLYLLNILSKQKASFFVFQIFIQECSKWRSVARSVTLGQYWLEVHPEHLNQFGMFQLDMEKVMAEIEYDLKKEDI